MKIAEYNLRNGTIRRQISTSTKATRELFAGSQFSKYSHFKIYDLENVGLGHNVQTVAATPFDGKYLTSNLMAIVMFAFSQRFRAPCMLNSNSYLDRCYTDYDDLGWGKCSTCIFLE